MKKFFLLGFFTIMVGLAIHFPPSQSDHPTIQTELSDHSEIVQFASFDTFTATSYELSQEASIHSELAKNLLEYKVKYITELTPDRHKFITGTISLLFDKSSELRTLSAIQIGEETGVINRFDYEPDPYLPLYKNISYSFH